jgi:glucuronoarabinoxylan endo-1,4-beta-xylanase
MKTKLLIFTAIYLLVAGCSKDNVQNISQDDSQRHLKGTATIDGNVRYQMIDGIGFSSAWCGTLSDAKNNALYNTLGFSLLRVRFDQNNNFTDEKNNATAAHARGAKVLGCPWKIPTAYRSGNTIPSNQYVNYCNWLKTAASTINCDFVSIKNEPDGSADDGNLSGDQIRDIIKAGGSNIGKPLVCSDAINFNDSWTDPTLNDATAASKISYVSGHLYGGGLYVHQNAINKGKRVWQTEYYIDNSRDNWDRCIVLAKNIMDCMNNQFSAYFFWWVYDADASVNLVNQSGTIYKSGYTGGQFAKWIRPGKQRIGCPYNPTTNVYVTAYRNGGIVVVALNQGTSSVNQTFSFANISGLSTMNVHRTSGSENMASVGTVTVSNNTFTYTLPAKSVTTFHQY